MPSALVVSLACGIILSLLAYIWRTTLKRIDESDARLTAALAALHICMEKRLDTVNMAIRERTVETAARMRAIEQAQLDDRRFQAHIEQVRDVFHAENQTAVAQILRRLDAHGESGGA